MSNVTFLWIFSRGIELGVIVLCLLPLRALLHKRFPRLFSYILWITLPVNLVYQLVVKLMSSHTANLVHIHKKPDVVIDENIVYRMKWFWICGTVAIVVWFLFSYIRFLRRLIGCIRVQKGIYLADRIRTPFTLGLLWPKIYLPVSLKKEYYEYVILHERVHISRKDVWMKYLAVLFLGVFWFQPLLWFACNLFMDDMEEACDETVIRERGAEFREAYAKALVEISFQAGKVYGAAVGYGNGTIKSRVKHIMSYKKANKRGQFLAIVVCVLFIAFSGYVSWQVPRMVQREQVNENGNDIMIIRQDGTGKKVMLGEK